MKRLIVKSKPQRRNDVDGSTGRRRLEPEARREAIIQAAIGYFAEVGFGGTTRDLAARAGVTQALIYQYFASKAELRETVYERIYLGRISPQWLDELRQRDLPIGARLTRFYGQYTTAIFTYEWMRIFMWAGLAGDALNRRYLEHVGASLLAPIREEIILESKGAWVPEMEDLWNLHGGIVHLGIRRFIYRLPTPEDAGPATAAAVARFLSPLNG